MNLTYHNDKLYLNGEPLDVDNPADLYAELLVNSVQCSMEYSPQLQVAFFERLRPAAAAYYDWRIMPNEQWETYEDFLNTDGDDDIYDPDADDPADDEQLLENLVHLKVAINAAIQELVEDGCE